MKRFRSLNKEKEIAFIIDYIS